MCAKRANLGTRRSWNENEGSSDVKELPVLSLMLALSAAGAGVVAMSTASRCSRSSEPDHFGNGLACSSPPTGRASAGTDVCSDSQMFRTREPIRAVGRISR